MDIGKIKPRAQFVITTLPETDERISASGIIIEENTDDLLIHAKVVASASTQYKEGDNVVVSLVEAQPFRDRGTRYLFIHEDHILGIYGGSTE